jgi:ADP-heptose:LPS heptosyltransferase
MVKFLIIRFSSIGDIVLTTPVIRCIKQQVEDAEVHFVTKKQFASVVNANPYIDKLHILDNNLNDLINELKFEHFDHIIDLHHNLRTLRLKSKLKVPDFSFNKINIEKWLITSFLKIDRLPKNHIVDRYLDTVKLFDIQNDGAGLDFFILPENEVLLNQLPAEFQNGYIALVIGAKHATKQMPDEKLGELCRLINLPVVLMGGKDDKERGDKIAEIAGSNVFNSCGNFNIQQSASLVKQASLVISHDTGLMHIAAAFKKKIISIWGNTIPEFGMYPYVSNDLNYTFEAKGLKCRPCSKIGYDKCPKKHFKCMNQIPITDIAEKAKQLYLPVN